MSRAKEWEEEIIRRFPSVDCDGLPITAEFIAILEEKGGFEEGANLQYNALTHDIQVVLGPDCNCLVYPLYGTNQIQLKCVFHPTASSFSTMAIRPTADAIRIFLSIYWSAIFSKESE